MNKVQKKWKDLDFSDKVESFALMVLCFSVIIMALTLVVEIIFYIKRNI